MNKTLSSILFVAFLLTGCASIFSPRYQDVTIVTHNPSSKVYLDDVFIGKGDTVVANVHKDCTSKQVTVETDSCKNVNKVLLQDRKSKWFILSIIPFGLLVYPVQYDNAQNTWVFDDCLEFKKPRQFQYWTPDMKRVYIRNIKYDIKKVDNILLTYSYNNYLAGKSPNKNENQDSIYGNDIQMEEIFTKKLKDLHLSDTSDNIFVDHQNTLLLHCNIQKATASRVTTKLKSTSYIYFPGFLNVEFETQWVATDLYGDTLYCGTVRSKSGDFSLSDKNKDNIHQKMILDVLENSWLDLMDKKEMKELLKFEPVKPISLENLVLTKPEKYPDNMEDAMKACFTIKSDKGHGSGFLITNDGYVITNYHVINKAKDLKAIDNNGNEFPLKLIRFNKEIDLALLKIDSNFEFAFPVPTEKNFKTGQDAFAIGTPKSVQLGQTLSKGIISGFRTKDHMSLIQSDISINKGNSGGAVVGSTGELLGVVVSKMFGIGTEGISFSIPAFDIMKALALSYQ